MAITAPAFEETQELVAPAFEETSDLAPSFEETTDVSQPSGPDLAEKSSRFLASAAESSINVLGGATRLISNLPVVQMLSNVAKEMGGAGIEEFQTELEGASSRAQDDYGVDPKQNDKLLSAVASGAGSILPTLASGPFAPVTTALMMGEQGFQEADQAGGTTTQKVVSAAGNALTGLVTEKLLGVPALLKSAKAARIPEGTFKQLIGSVTKQIGLSFAREGTQETLEQLSQDTIAKYIAAYDPERKIFDSKKLLTTFLAGGIVGGTVGGTLQLAENVAPKEEMQREAGQIDQALGELIRPPSQTTQGTPILSPSEIQAVPAGTPEDLNVLETQETKAPTKTVISPHKPQLEGESIVSTAIQIPNGPPLTGDAWNASHNTMINKAIEAYADDTKALYDNMGFIVQDAGGNQRFASREEALEVARKTGQVDETKLSQNVQGLQSEALKTAVSESEGVPTQDAAPTEKKELKDEDFLDRAREVIRKHESEGGKSSAALLQRRLNIGVERAQRILALVSSEKSSVTYERAAQTLQPFFTQAVEVAKKAGAVDPESAASEAMIGLSQQASEGKTTLDNPGALLSEASRRQALKQVQKETAAKRGGGTETVEFEISGASTGVGPRTEAVSRESVSSIEEAVEAMPEADRNVMRAMMDDPTLSIEELASQTKLTPDQVKKAKTRAREALRQFVRSQGIGERMAPGAANEAEFRRARYIAATDIFRNTENRTEFEREMYRQYEDAFTASEMDEAYWVAEMVSESKGTKSIPDVVSQLMGLQKTGEGITSIKNKQIDAERVKRGVPPIMGLARKSNPALWDEMVRKLDEDKQFQANLISRIKNDPAQGVSDLEQLTLLHAEIAAENDYSEATKDVNEAKDERTLLEAKERRNELSNKLNDLQQVARVAGSVAGKSLQARKMMVGNDYSVGRLMADLQADQLGEQLTKEQVELTQKVSENVQRTTSELDARTEELQIKESEKAFDQSIKAMEGKPILDSRIMALAEKIVTRLDAAADKARARIRARAFNFNAGVDPVVIYDLAVIGASKLAHGLRDLAWRNSMKGEFGDGIEPHLDEIFEKSDEMINRLEEEVPGPDRAKVKVAVRKTGTKDVIKDTQQKIKVRIDDGEPLTDLRAYVQKMALAMVRSGINTRDGLVQALQPILDTFQPGISRREVMDLVSGYGDSKPLDMEKAKVELRDIKGQLQQLAKIEDLQARVPLQKTGPPRRTISDTERRLQKQVNELKKRLGVVVTDPETQLKSTLSSITTGLKNQISDLTHQIETGEKPIPGTPSPTNEQIESLKALRNRIKETLKGIEGTPEISQEQRIKNAEQGLERSIADLETRIKNKDYLPSSKPVLESDKIKALKDRRDSLRVDLDALRTADTDLRDTRTFDRLMQQAGELEARLAKGDVQPKTKAARIEDDLVTEARDKISALREQMIHARKASPEGQQARLDSAIEAVEHSIASMDARLKSGDTSVPGKPKSPTSPILERLRAERDVMRKLVTELRKTPLDPTTAALKAYKSRLARQTADLQDRIAKGDFEKKIRLPLDISSDPEAVRILAEKQEWQKKFELARYEAKIAGENMAEKAFRLASEVLNVAKSSVGSVDVSAFARQAFVDTMAHPVNAFRNLITSVQSMNENVLKREQAKLALRPNAKNGVYHMAGVDFTDLEGPLSKREEVFRSDWANIVPWIRWSSRQYTMFLNLARADAIDRMVASSPVPLTRKELQYAGKTVNTFTGRGDLGRFAGAADLLSLPLWSPRLYVSRLQTLVGRPLWQKDAGRLRKVVAKEYMRAAGSGLAIVALGILAGADIERDPASSDFVKLRFGNLRIDPWGGIQQWLVFLTRVLSGEYKTTTGKKFDLDYPRKRPGPYDPTYGDVLTRMFRSKLNPIAAAVWSYHTGEDIQGKEVTAFSATRSAVLPLSVFNDDVLPMAKEFGLTKTGLLMLLGGLGIGVQHYDPNEKRRR